VPKLLLLLLVWLLVMLLLALLLARQLEHRHAKLQLGLVLVALL